MRLAITGAGGFIGSHLVRASLARGHEVVAIVRDATAFEGDAEAHSVDLERGDGLARALEGCDCVVHLAAAMSGNDLETRTLSMTRTLLSAMENAGVAHLVLLSSLSVLDYARQAPGSRIDEQVPVNPRDRELGPYARAKRDQEELAEAWRQAAPERSLFVLRAGLVYDSQHLAEAHAGMAVRELGLTVLHGGEVPVAHVDNVSSASALAAEHAAQCAGKAVTLLVVDDDLPSQTSYLKALAGRGALAAWSLPVSWRVFAGLAWPLRAGLSSIGQAGRIPDSLRRNSVAARLCPFEFANEAAKRLLGWQSTTSFQATFPIS